jgi:hypothetical protein
VRKRRTKKAQRDNGKTLRFSRVLSVKNDIFSIVTRCRLAKRAPHFIA